MQHITKLIRQARKAVNGSDFAFAIGFVEYDSERQLYTAKPQPWDGVKGSGADHTATMPKWWHEEWDTQQEATDALNRLFEGFGIQEKDRVIFIIDLV